MLGSHQNTIFKQGYWLHTYAVESCMDINLRRVRHAAATYEQDIYPDFWALYIYDDAPLALRARLAGVPVDRHDKIAVYVPPYQLFDIHLPTGDSSWKSYCVRTKPESFLPDTTSVFLYTGPEDILGYGALVDYLRRMRDFMVPLRPLVPSAGLANLTTFMNTYFCEEARIEDLYRELRIPTSTAEYMFNRFYGMPAVAYRNKLRIFRALKLIREGKSLTETCYELGYSDYSTFYRQFCRNIGVSPSNFVLKPGLERASS